MYLDPKALKSGTAAVSAASYRTVPVRVPFAGGETPLQLAGEDACATFLLAVANGDSRFLSSGRV